MFRKATSLRSNSPLERHLHLCFSPPLSRDRGPHPMPRFVLPSKREGFSPSRFSQHLPLPDRCSSFHRGSVLSFPLCHPPGQPVTISLVSAPSLPLPWPPCLSETPEELTEGNGKMCVCVGGLSVLWLGAGGDERGEGSWSLGTSPGGGWCRGKGSPPRGVCLEATAQLRRIYWEKERIWGSDPRWRQQKPVSGTWPHGRDCGPRAGRSSGSWAATPRGGRGGQDAGKASFLDLRAKIGRAHV